MLMGGEHTTVLFNKPSIQYIMKDRKLGRDNFNEMVSHYGFGMQKDEIEKYYAHNTPANPGELHPRYQDEKQNAKYMLMTDKVNELTAEFTRRLGQDLDSLYRDGPGQIELCRWLRTLMFRASTTALWGEKIFEVSPDLEEHFWQFDQDMLSLFFRLPKWLIPKAFLNRDTALDCVIKWNEFLEKATHGQIPDPDTIAWEPYYGSRLQRARRLTFKKRNLSAHAIAGLDLGFLFGLSSNAIPATLWALLHIIDSRRANDDTKQSLYDQVLAEVRECQNEDRSINIAALVVQPVLLSTMHEVLRVYVDVLVSRQINHDMTLPFGRDAQARKSAQGNQSIFIKKGALVMMPSYVAHMDPTTWQSPDFPHFPSPELFYPYRFLTAPPDDTSKKPTFTTDHAENMFMPFGGGKTICPGRIFARQEMMAAVAMVLLTFEFDFVSYTDQNGLETSKFPGLRDTFPGSAVMVSKGDMKVNIERRT